MYRYIKNFIKDYVYVDESTTKENHHNKYENSSQSSMENHNNKYESNLKNNNNKYENSSQSIEENHNNKYDNVTNFIVNNNQTILHNDETKNELKDEIKNELKDEIKNELKDEIKNELKDEILNELKDEIKNEPKDNNGKSGGNGLSGSGSISGNDLGNDSSSAGPSNFRSFFDNTFIILINITASILDTINEILTLM